MVVIIVCVGGLALVVLVLLISFFLVSTPYNIDRSLRKLALSRAAPSGQAAHSEQNKQRVCVVGAGISGLYTAYKLQDHCNVVLLESSGAPGGHNRSSPVDESEVPVQYGCSGTATSPILTNLVAELGLHRKRTKQWVAALVEGQHEFTRYDAVHPSPKRSKKWWLYSWARSYSCYEQLRFLAWWLVAHVMYYLVPLRNWDAERILLKRNTGCDDVFIPQCGINVFVDRCDLGKCPYSYFLRYAALYFGREFFCIEEGNHALIRRLHEQLKCEVHVNSRVTQVSGEEGQFYVHHQSGSVLGPFHQVVMACQPHQVVEKLPPQEMYNAHRECLSCFETVVARSAVHADATPFVSADDRDLELGVMYDRRRGLRDGAKPELEHHYLHVNPAEFYSVSGLPSHTFVTVSYDDADPKDVISADKIKATYSTTLSRVKVDQQQGLPRLIRKLHFAPGGIHLANAAYIGLMWHEDGLTMGELAYRACLRGLSATSCSSQEISAEKDVASKVGDAHEDSESTADSSGCDRSPSETLNSNDVV